MPADGSGRLPSLSSLARLAGVGRVTMWKAVRECSRRGLLEARPGAGIRVIGHGAQPPPLAAAPRGTRYQKVKQALLDDISAGVYAHGHELPPVPSLAQHNGVCQATVRKALAELELDGTITRVRRRYQVSLASNIKARATVVVVQWVPQRSTLIALDSECNRLGLRPHNLSLVPLDTLLSATRALHQRQADPVVGHIMVVTGGSPDQYRSVLRTLLPAGRPTAIIDESGDPALASLQGGRLLRVFSLSGHLHPGLLMGRHLLELGHRRIAYISAVHDSPWSQRRLEGLRQAFARAGIPDGVLAFTHDGSDEHARTSRRATEDLEWLRSRLATSSTQRRTRLSEALDITQDQLHWMIRLAHLSRRNDALAEEALRVPSVTAWVAASDIFALSCLRLARSHGVDVPGRLSIAGFDDTSQAFSEGLTSYNPDRQAAVQAALSFILGSSRAVWSRRAGYVTEIPGYVTVRETTGGG